MKEKNKNFINDKVEKDKLYIYIYKRGSTIDYNLYYFTHSKTPAD